MASVIRPDEIDFAAYIRETEAKQKVRPASEYVEEIIANLWGDKRDPMAYMPWDKTHDKFHFRPGEVTLWAGINGHGKSLVTGQVGLSLMGQSERVCIASFEMKPRKTLERMARQWSGNSPHSEHDTPETIELASDIYRQFGEWTDRKLWLYDQQGTVDAETVLGVARYCAKELRIGHIFIDSLMKCVRGEDDYNGQKSFVDELCSLARDCMVHIHLVHHIKKLSSEDQQPGKYDAKGSGSISDQVDNYISVWRNKRKERDVEAKKSVSVDEPDAFLICDKQRNGEWEGRIGLWFHKASQQFTGGPTDETVSFSNFPPPEVVLKHRASSETSKSIVGVMEGNGPMTCGEIGKPLGINHRHVRQVMQTLICRGMAHLIPNTSPRRYSLKPGAVYVETVADREELPVKRIHRPIGEWESGQLKAAAPNSVFSFGEHA